jgi:uncharacterized protein YbjT (DUF2867 family)
MQHFNGLLRDRIREDSLISIPAGGASTSFIDMRDMAEVATVFVTKGRQQNRTCTLTGGDPLNIHEVAEILTEELGREITYIPTTDDNYRRHLKTAGWPDVFIEATIRQCQLVRQGWTAAVTSDVSTILGREPATFTQYVHDYLQYWAPSAELIA